MKVDATHDIDGRLAAVSNRLAMMHEALSALADAYGNVGAPSQDALSGFGAACREIRDEVESILVEGIRQANEEYEKQRIMTKRKEHPA
jgi:hypothetical protein